MKDGLRERSCFPLAVSQERLFAQHATPSNIPPAAGGHVVAEHHPANLAEQIGIGLGDLAEQLAFGRRLHGVEHLDDAEQADARLPAGAGEAALDGGGHVANDFPAWAAPSRQSGPPPPLAARARASRSASAARSAGKQESTSAIVCGCWSARRASRSSASRPCKNRKGNVAGTLRVPSASDCADGTRSVPATWRIPGPPPLVRRRRI